MNKNKARGVSWVKPAEPSFLTKFKNDVGFKEGPDIDTKRKILPSPDDDSGSDREDELPQVVVLQEGHLSQEEVKKMKGGCSQEEVKKKGGDAPADGRILFKKPAKRSPSDRFQGITASSSKKRRSEGGPDRKEVEEEVKPRKTLKNTSLLSFGGEEEEEGEEEED